MLKWGRAFTTEDTEKSPKRKPDLGEIRLFLMG
jgi:hypothetical protein